MADVIGMSDVSTEDTGKGSQLKTGGMTRKHSMANKCKTGQVYNTKLKRCVSKASKPMTDKEADIWGKYISKGDLAPQIYDFSKRESTILDSLKRTRSK